MTRQLTSNTIQSLPLSLAITLACVNILISPVRYVSCGSLISKARRNRMSLPLNELLSGLSEVPVEQSENGELSQHTPALVKHNDQLQTVPPRCSYD